MKKEKLGPLLAHALIWTAFTVLVVWAAYELGWHFGFNSETGAE